MCVPLRSWLCGSLTASRSAASQRTGGQRVEPQAPQLAPALGALLLLPLLLGGHRVDLGAGGGCGREPGPRRLGGGSGGGAAVWRVAEAALQAGARLQALNRVIIGQQRGRQAISSALSLHSAGGTTPHVLDRTPHGRSMPLISFRRSAHAIGTAAARTILPRGAALMVCTLVATERLRGVFYA